MTSPSLRWSVPRPKPDELQRIPIPRTRVNKGKRKRPRLLDPGPIAPPYLVFTWKRSCALPNEMSDENASLLTWPHAPKLPIIPIRTQRAPINRINKPKEPTGTPPVTQ